MDVPKRLDVTPYIGKTFGSWTVVGLADRGPQYQTRVMCQCSCGLVKPVELGLLKAKRTRGCGPCAGRAKLGAQGTKRRFMALRTNPRTMTPQERAEMAEDLEACQLRIAELEAKLAARWQS